MQNNQQKSLTRVFCAGARSDCGSMKAMLRSACMPPTASLLLLLAFGAGCGDGSSADSGEGEGEADAASAPEADAASAPDIEVPESSGPLPCLPCTAAETYEYKGAGIYEVPLVPESGELAEAAVTIVQEAQLHVSAGEVILEYDLPAELTGVVQQVELTGDLPDGAEPLLLTGPAGTATCYLENFSPGAFDLFCLEELPGVAIDRAALEALLESRGLDRDVIDAHLEVTDLFIEDPIGILEATLMYSGNGAD